MINYKIYDKVVGYSLRLRSFMYLFSRTVILAMVLGSWSAHTCYRSQVAFKLTKLPKGNWSSNAPNLDHMKQSALSSSNFRVLISSVVDLKVIEVPLHII